MPGTVLLLSSVSVDPFFDFSKKTPNTMADDSWAKQVDDQEKAQLAEKIKDLKVTLTKSPNNAADGGGDAAAGVRSVETTKVTNKDDRLNELSPPKQNRANDSDTSDKDEPEISTADVSLIRKKLRDKLVNIKHEVEVLRKDPKSPLYFVKSFEELHLRPELLKGIYGMGFNWPSKIQETALPMLLADPPKNMIAQSQSGTGKTAAFVLAMLSRVDPTLRYPQAVCLAPTYELALQIGEVAEKMGKDIPDLYCRYAVRGERLARGQRISEQIIIGTPGTTLDWAIKYKFFDPSKVRVFVLDEADVMIATQGHQDQSIRIQSNTELFTFYFTFLDTRRTVSWLAEQMSKEGHAVAILSGDLTVEQRVAVLNRFREGKEKVLITTNVTARGIDVEQVTLVVNFDVPVDVNGHADCETYLHRIGRTGRFGKSGIAINMVDGPRAMGIMKKIEEHFGRKISRLNADDIDEIEKLEA
uniref:RNA helicase n=1 Tax=Saccoglossus kowalevskii TaxID=10224 RepID=A0ABM0LW78_SACKO|nr:PREDICTED: ATP-dependent RNA helicase DDX19A-like [Saccoglossus kowalevskii]